ncbi:MAG: hypothetical protein HY606_00970 [Planctomycetes bacterium]|nr:hypothetical protein [Planctomycetota bacterium]
MKKIIFLTMLITASCSDYDVKNQPPSKDPVPVYEMQQGTLLELEKYYGKQIMVSGKLENVDGKHAKLVTKANCPIYIAHIDRQAVNLDWFSLIGKDVQVVGKLVAETSPPIDGKIQGPFLTYLKSLKIVN